jgi:hypothetical protein
MALGVASACIWTLMIAQCNLPQVRSTLAEREFQDQFENTDINKSISLSTYAGGGDTGNWDSTFSLQLRNNTNEPVGFNPDSDIYGMVFDPLRQSWTEIANDVAYSPRRRMLGSASSNGLPSVASVDFHAASRASSKTDSLRIVVRAHLLDENLEPLRTAVAFYDVRISH